MDSDYILKSVYETVSIVGNSTVPFEGYVKTGWNAMTDRYSHFTIAVLFSVILHEVSISAATACLCGSHPLFDNPL